MGFGVGGKSGTEGYFARLSYSESKETKSRSSWTLQLGSRGQLTQFLHLLFKLPAPAAEYVRAHGHGEDVVGEFTASVTVLHFVVAELLEGFAGRDDLVEQAA